MGKTDAGGYAQLQESVRDDILTAVAGPVSNFLTAFVAVIALADDPARLAGWTTGRRTVPGPTATVSHAPAGATVRSLCVRILINVVLAVFNLIPLPPLDGSHVIRHFLSLRGAAGVRPHRLLRDW